MVFHVCLDTGNLILDFFLPLVLLELLGDFVYHYVVVGIGDLGIYFSLSKLAL